MEGNIVHNNTTIVAHPTPEEASKESVTNQNI
jgi:hypothetical protein